MPSLVDTHTHIYVEKFADDLDAVLDRAREAGVEAMVVPATKPSEFDRLMDLAGAHPEINPAIGVHPHHAGELSESDLAEVERLGADRRVVAIGEIGLDYYYHFAPRERQIEVFREQLRIAKRLDLPCAIHNRESDDDLLEVLEQEQDGTLRFQLHCFSSTPEVLARTLELGGMISFTGNITYEKSKLGPVVEAVPKDRIMIETDAPYLTPVPFRGKRNEPSYLAHIARKGAELRGETLEEFIQMTTDNARRFFKLALLVVALFGLTTAAGVAQTNPEPVRTIDTVQHKRFDKWFGIGAHLASSTYISQSVTEAAALGYGFWLTASPLQGQGIDWLQFDVIYTYVKFDKVEDSLYSAINRGLTPPPNYHTTVDFSLRLIANANNAISFFAGLGLTYFHNEYLVDKWHFETDPQDTKYREYKENAFGFSGSFGISLNINTPYGLIAPTGEWRVASITSERKLPQHNQEFIVSQPRFGLIIYPALGKIF